MSPSDIGSLSMPMDGASHATNIEPNSISTNDTTNDSVRDPNRR